MCARNCLLFFSGEIFPFRLVDSFLVGIFSLVPFAPVTSIERRGEQNREMMRGVVDMCQEKKASRRC